MTKWIPCYLALLLLTVALAAAVGTFSAAGADGALLRLWLGIAFATAVAGCFYFTQADRRQISARPLLLVLALVLFVGTLTRIADFMADRLDHDEYACMTDVAAPFAEYRRTGSVASFVLPIQVHYWVSARLLGSSLYSFRVMSWFGSIVAALAWVGMLRQQWPQRPVLIIAGLALLVFNAHYAYLAWYSMLPYMAGFLTALGLYYLFVRALDGPLRGNDRVVLWLVAIPGAFFSSVTNLVPLGVGGLLLLVFRMLGDPSPKRRGWGEAWGIAGSLAPLLLFPAIILAVNWYAPFTNIGPEKRPDMAPLFFPQSSFSQDLSGLGRWLALQFTSAITTLLRPCCGSPVVRSAAVMLTAGLAAFGAAAILRHWKQESLALKYTLCYTLSLLGVVAAGGALGYYPFGSARYMSYVLPPLLVLAAAGFDTLGAVVGRAFGWLKGLPWRASFAIASVMVAALSLWVAHGQMTAAADRIAANDRCFAEISQFHGATVAVDSWAAPYVIQKVPGVAKTMIAVGWGRPWLKERNADLVERSLATHRTAGDTSGVLVVHKRGPLKAEDFPLLLDVLGRDHTLASAVACPDINVTLFLPHRGQGEESGGAF